MTIDVGGPINAPSSQVIVGGVTLAELRQRLRTQLSSYAANTLISNMNPDAEAQFINDGIGQLWPWDFQIVNKAILIPAATQQFILPADCEHVFTVSYANKDLGETTNSIYRIPQNDGWTYEPAFTDAALGALEDGSLWADATQKVLTVELNQLGLSTNINQGISTTQKYLIVRYARRWAAMTQEMDSIDPSPNRIQAVIHFAAAGWFMSQFQLNSESIRYSNYIKLAQVELQVATVNLQRDPKQLYSL